MFSRAAILGCAALFLASAASAATYHVLPNGTGDYARIQDAIDAAVSGKDNACNAATAGSARAVSGDFALPRQGLIAAWGRQWRGVM